MSTAELVLEPQVLQRFLVDNGVDVAGPLDVELISGGKSNLTFMVSDGVHRWVCLLYTSPSPRDRTRSRMPSSA